ncbi:MAG: AI-2E family transporter [Cytophagaceae bacterium]|nr:AI-2E family transporter [Cytophagaceae bacterium]MBK9511071.1 AI-2E family transporter [Cytophagaceae bacterium]MBK9936286.1 AI-2E family transporter [Cytophagaceae bacterium]MBL0303820.1 AI-2E family transporter [Cytophagaceae bacterium]MBL0326636.1 AI-2E family transporter [Cytophagaceae bacterium]
MSVSTKNIRPLEILQYVVLISFILYFGRSLFIPLAFGMLISFVLFPISNWLISKRFPGFLAYGLPVILIFLFLVFVFFLMINQILEFTNEWTSLRVKLLEAIDNLSLFVAQNFDYSADSQKIFLQNLLDQSGGKALAFLQSMASSFSEGIFTLIMVPVFATLILAYHKLLTQTLYTLFPAERREAVRQVLVNTVKSYYDFVKGMALVYLAVGILNSAGLAIIGIPHPILFGFLASVLTFIPYVGIMVASLLPISVAWVTYDSAWYAIYVIIVFAIVQVLEAYILFPFIVGNRLKINTLSIFIAIVLGGIFWGAAGMILFIPMVSILKLIADKTEKLKSISILLGEN